MKFTKEDIELIEKFIEIKNKGYYADGKQLTEVYNRVLEKNVNVTQCGSCLRQRVSELENALIHYKKAQERQKELQEADNKVEPNEATVEAENKPTAKKVGRPPKKQ